MKEMIYYTFHRSICQDSSYVLQTFRRMEMTTHLGIAGSRLSAPSDCPLHIRAGEMRKLTQMTSRGPYNYDKFSTAAQLAGTAL
jgi:hypothetical protein